MTVNTRQDAQSLQRAFT